MSQCSYLLRAVSPVVWVEDSRGGSAPVSSQNDSGLPNDLSTSLRQAEHEQHHPERLRRPLKAGGKEVPMVARRERERLAEGH